jgi:hypothetical protein
LIGMSGASSTARKRHLLRLCLVAATFAGASLALVGCASTTAAPASNAGSVPGVSTGQTSTSISAKSADGITVHVPNTKPSVLFFFSVQCGSCGPESRILAAEQRAHPTQANYVLIDVEAAESSATINSFLVKNQASNLAYTTDKSARLLNTYQVHALSTVVVTDPAGKVSYRAVDPSATEIQSALVKAGTK